MILEIRQIVSLIRDCGDWLAPEQTGEHPAIFQAKATHLITFFAKVSTQPLHSVHYCLIAHIYISLQVKHTGFDRIVTLARKWFNANDSLCVVKYYVFMCVSAHTSHHSVSSRLP